MYKQDDRNYPTINAQPFIVLVAMVTISALKFTLFYSSLSVRPLRLQYNAHMVHS